MNWVSISYLLPRTQGAIPKEGVERAQESEVEGMGMKPSSGHDRTPVRRNSQQFGYLHRTSTESSLLTVTITLPTSLGPLPCQPQMNTQDLY